MTRVEENQKICEQLDNTNFLGNDSEHIKIKMMSAQINFLEDISKSLAMMADLNLASFRPSLYMCDPGFRAALIPQEEENDGK